jgi:hypothetical protein
LPGSTLRPAEETGQNSCWREEMRIITQCSEFISASSRKGSGEVSGVQPGHSKQPSFNRQPKPSGQPSHNEQANLSGQMEHTKQSTHGGQSELPETPSPRVQPGQCAQPKQCAQPGHSEPACLSKHTDTQGEGQGQGRQGKGKGKVGGRDAGLRGAGGGPGAGVYCLGPPPPLTSG